MADSKKIDDGGMAFPGENYTESGLRNGVSMGMSLRDWFAGNAPEVPEWFGEALPVREYNLPNERGLQTPVVPNDAWDIVLQQYWMDRLINWRWAYADAMIAARKADRDA